MAIGMAAAILILLWVQDEWSYDRHFKNAGELYRIIQNENPSGGESSLSSTSTRIINQNSERTIS